MIRRGVRLDVGIRLRIGQEQARLGVAMAREMLRVMKWRSAVSPLV